MTAETSVQRFQEFRAETIDDFLVVQGRYELGELDESYDGIEEFIDEYEQLFSELKSGSEADYNSEDFKDFYGEFEGETGERVDNIVEYLEAK